VRFETVDGNEAAARVAYRLSEVIPIYPITPASGMAESADAWAAQRVPNVWGTVPEIVEMQSEAGAAGALHGATTRGALATSFTASQGLLLMIPDMYKIAGELSPAVLHVAARAVATHALSIFGDHSDVMAVRSTGWAILVAGSVQEAADLALVAHASTLQSRVPFVHAFDGFRTSHEIAKVRVPDDDDLAALIEDGWIADHRLRGLDPDRPAMRGTAQNPDVFFQAREACTPFHAAVPGVVLDRMARLGARRDHAYGIVEYHGAPDADRVLVLMGSAIGAAREAVAALVASGERVGVLQVRLYRPFPGAAVVSAIPESARTVMVLDRTKEPGAPGEPLYLDVVAALAEAAGGGRPMPRVFGGRYGLASKEFTPAMAKGVLDAARSDAPRRSFTVGIADDVSHSSVPVDRAFRTDGARLRAVFYGLGSDGTVSANKASAKIVGEHTDLHAQGYFVYDSKKSGSITVSHLRFDPDPILSTYLVEEADFVACHQFGLLDRLDVLAIARPGATVLLDSPHGPEDTWDRLPVEVQEAIVERSLEVHVVDAQRVAREAGLRGQVNTVMQACFFALTDLLSLHEATAAMQDAVRKAYGKRGGAVIEANVRAIAAAPGSLGRLPVPASVTATRRRRPVVPSDAPDFVQRVTARMLAGEGDLLPVSALPPDGTFPTATARYEKRRLAHEIPVWEPDLCVDCARCALVCPHAAIRLKIADPAALEGTDLASKEFRSHDHPGLSLTIQVAPEDCTGCGICVDVCPGHDKQEPTHRALAMEPIEPHLERERIRWSTFLDVEPVPPGVLDPASVKGSQAREPRFEFSGACAGCGETPYLKLLTQLFGDRAIVANATGCSSIYGGNLPTTPWSVGADGRGPAWSNSLFEDDAEFGLGIRLALDRQADAARLLLEELAPHVGHELAAAVLAVDASTRLDDPGLDGQRERVAELDRRLGRLVEDPDPTVARSARRLAPLTHALIHRSLWIVGGDGWAYDIGSSGLDHVLGSGRDVNVLVLDTEVYSNTGGQASKSTPRGAVAKFAAAGKRTPKKDLGAEARRYGDVYIAQVAVGANDVQTVKAFVEAEAWPGPSIVIAYSTCIAHGIDMARSMSHQRDAVRSGYWPLYRYQPTFEPHGHPFRLDCRDPSVPVADFLAAETRFKMLERADPEHATELLALAQADVDERWQYYRQLAGVERTIPHLPDPEVDVEAHESG
jgi:pyruvate-ferredoxin/flavodoxin oxidoreductase